MKISKGKVVLVAVLTIICIIVYTQSEHEHNNTALRGGEKSRADRNSFVTIPLSQEDITSVEKFVFFVGYPRSGHSIIGSLMDAHPNMIIAHEYKVFHELKSMKVNNREHLYNLLYNKSYRNSHAVNGLRSSKNSRKGYALDVGGSWQGRFTKLKVIGDKSGGQASRMYANSPSNFTAAYYQLQDLVGVPMRGIHVVRNPYDMISTQLLYWQSSTNGPYHAKLSNATEEHKYNNVKSLTYHANKTLTLMLTVYNMIRDCKLTILEIHLMDLVNSPRDTMQKICNYLDLECSEHYLRICSDKVYTSVPKTRLLVEWPQNLRQRVFEEMQQYPYFQQYSFTGD